MNPDRSTPSDERTNGSGVRVRNSTTSKKNCLFLLSVSWQLAIFTSKNGWMRERVAMEEGSWPKEQLIKFASDDDPVDHSDSNDASPEKKAPMYSSCISPWAMNRN